MNTDRDEILMRFASDAGLEIFQLLVARSEQLGARTLEDILSALTGATAVCLANVLRPAVERAPNRAAVADGLIASSTRQARRLLDPVIAAETKSS